MNNKILLVAVNSKYIHSNLAVRYLKSFCRNEFPQISIEEFSINDNTDNILGELYLYNADIYAFSCYIWNIEPVLKICSSLKKVNPEAVIVLGGPEVSYDALEVLNKNPFIDYVVYGEGEKTFLELLKYLVHHKGALEDIDGLCWRKGTDAILNKPRALIELDELPFPYDDIREVDKKIVYYETSRGCPYNCQYCLSSTIHGVRFLSMDRVRQDIAAFVRAGVRQVKLVDRTFNCRINRSVEIMEYIVSLNTDTNFHFEISADNLNDAFFEVLKKAPKGQFQFEIGVQSTNPDTLHEIKRTTDFEKLRDNVSRLLSIGNTHIHLDLIAGLPLEDFNSFRRSFNDVYEMKPHMLQLGFLKLLKGSGIRSRAEDYGIEYNNFPPYEVIKTGSISYSELLKLKRIEHVLNLYYNSGRFVNVLEYLLKKLDTTPFDFYKRLSEYWSSNDLLKGSKSLNDQYVILYRYVLTLEEIGRNPEELRAFNEILKLDWLLYSRTGSMPEVIERFNHSEVKELLHSYIKMQLSQAAGHFAPLAGMSFREAIKHISYEVFFSDVLNDPYSFTETVVFFYASDCFSIPLYKIKEQLNVVTGH